MTRKASKIIALDEHGNRTFDGRLLSAFALDLNA